MIPPRTRPCDQTLVEGRFRKAEQFLDAAERIRADAENDASVGDAVVTLWVHAGIAAADVICCAALGHHVQGDDHNLATSELSKVRPDGKQFGDALRVLLGMKTRAGYSAQPVNADQIRRARRRAEQLVEAARRLRRN